MSLSTDEDSKYTNRLNNLKNAIEDSFTETKKVSKSKYSDKEARILFEKELQDRMVQFSFKYGPDQSLFDQFVGYFKVNDISDSGTVSPLQFEDVMYLKVGVYHPVNKRVLRQVFAQEASSGKINYKNIAKDIILPIDTKLKKQRENFEEKREEQRTNEVKVALVDEVALN